MSWKNLAAAAIAATIAATATSAADSDSDSDSDSGAGAPPVRVVRVDCDRGDSIVRALRAKADELVIEISGVCTEDVEIRRDRVTLRGSDPAVDGIRAATAGEILGGAVFVREGRKIRLERLSLFGGDGSGLRVENARREVAADDCRLVDGRFGVTAIGSTVTLSGAEIRGNSAGGLAVSSTGQISCAGCTIVDNPDASAGIALFAALGSVLIVTDSTVAGSALAITGSDGARILITRSSVDSPVLGADLDGQASLVLRDSTIAGSLFARDYSRLVLVGATQSANPIANVIESQSYLDLNASAASASSLPGLTLLDTFSRANLRGGGQVDFLFCDNQAEAICSGIAPVFSTCALCP